MRRNADDDARPSAAGRTVLLLFALGALIMLGAAAYGLAHGQHGQRSTLERRFQGRAQLGAALVGSLFSATAPAQQAQAAERYGGKVTRAALDRQAAAGGSGFIAITDPQGRVLAASSGAPPGLGATLGAQPSYFRRALAGGGYGLSGIQPGGSIYTALPFRGATGTRVQVTGVKASLLSAFLGGTLKQVSTSAASTALIIDDQGGVIAEQGHGEQVGRPLRDASLRSAVAREMNGSISGARRFTREDIGTTGWRLVLVAGASSIFQPVEGVNSWLPWVILAIGALGLASVFVLLRRTLGAAAQVRVANAELARSNADLERFAYVASHDLSEPLRTIGGFGGLLERRYADRLDDEGRMMLGHVTGGAARLQALIDGLLSYARVSTAPRKVESVDLDVVTKEVIEAIRPAIVDRGARVEVEERLPVVDGERGQLSQLMQNLILNAIKFTHDDTAPQVEISRRQIHDGRWEIRVADNGVGVPPEQAERIFEMFQRGRVDRERSGTGIGLALCARIVERHGGSIRVEPREGGGSVFAFDLAGAPGATVPAPRSSEERVLAG